MLEIGDILRKYFKRRLSLVIFIRELRVKNISVYRVGVYIMGVGCCIGRICFMFIIIFN